MTDCYDLWIQRCCLIAPVPHSPSTCPNALTTALVMIVIVAVLLLWLLAACLEVQRSLQWWQSQQIQQLAQASEVIRNGLLQDSFVVRRNLELLLNQPPDGLNSSGEKCLAALEQLHTSLKALGHRLSPPYLEVSLPLAIRHLLEEWRSQFPEVPLQATLPHDYQQASYESNRLILMVLDELLKLAFTSAAENHSLHSIHVKLKQQASIHTFAIEFEYSDVFSLNHLLTTVDLRYLNRVFQVMTAGQCWQRRHGATLTWHLQWQPKKLR
ncbi:MAG: hypothetical protein NW220_13105 [Leptolyngbyaceae cyanobacterium bins.349]|nr:hypothetical protein [Leptolyngbyaceae cyanobacterium bins.349]